MPPSSMSLELLKGFSKGFLTGADGVLRGFQEIHRVSGLKT